MSVKGYSLGSQEDQMRAVLFGGAIGDALGLLTNFMDKKAAHRVYGGVKDKLEYKHKDLEFDFHRHRWGVGDWTDDTDQTILVMISLTVNHGRFSGRDFARRLLFWAKHGFPQLGDEAGMGIGHTTGRILASKNFLGNPQKVADQIWRAMDCEVAPNGGVPRTTVVGTCHYRDLEEVAENAIGFCKITHPDPRCQASCVAVSTAIALMLDRDRFYDSLTEHYDVEAIINLAYQQAVKHVFEVPVYAAKKTASLKKELSDYLFTHSRKLERLKLDERGKSGSTYKCMGAGFWALRQNDFEKALQHIVMEGGVADANASVAGSMLACKLGISALNVTRESSNWLEGLMNMSWLDEQFNRYLTMLKGGEFTPDITSLAPFDELHISVDESEDDDNNDNEGDDDKNRNNNNKADDEDFEDEADYMATVHVKKAKKAKKMKSDKECSVS